MLMCVPIPTSQATALCHLGGLTMPPTAKQVPGRKGEDTVRARIACPRCRRPKTLTSLPANFECADVICKFCGFLAQVKAVTISGDQPQNGHRRSSPKEQAELFRNHRAGTEMTPIEGIELPDRIFSIWTYYKGHGQLILRAPHFVSIQEQSFSTRVDILFKDVHSL